MNVAALVAVAAAAALGSAQGRPPMGGPGGGPGGMGPMTPQQQVDRMMGRMSQDLGLNAVQQTKVKAILMKAAIEQRKIQDARLAALKKVLTADQFKKVSAMRGMGGMRGGPGGGPGMGRGPGGGPGMGRGPGGGAPGGMRRGG